MRIALSIMAGILLFAGIASAACDEDDVNEAIDDTRTEVSAVIDDAGTQISAGVTEITEEVTEISGDDGACLTATAEADGTRTPSLRGTATPPTRTAEAGATATPDC